MIHIYEGDGKGKTTAAYGLAARAIGQEKTVYIAGFLKPESSGEYRLFSKLAEVCYFGGGCGFYGKMKKEDEKRVEKEVREGFFKVIKAPCHLLVLDEILDIVNFEIMTAGEVIEEIFKSPAEEIVLTGRNPKKEFLEIADYHTHFEKIKHPFDKGINARKGIEY